MIIRHGKPDPVKAAAQRLAGESLLPDPQPQFGRPVLPKDITDMGDTDLMNLFSELTAWHNYASAKAAQAAVEERAAEEHLRFEEAKAMVRDWVPGDKVTLARAQREASPEIHDLKDAVLGAYALRKLTESMATGLERSVALVSREVTRRTSSAPHTNRANKWNA